MGGIAADLCVGESRHSKQARDFNVIQQPSPSDINPGIVGAQNWSSLDGVVLAPECFTEPGYQLVELTLGFQETSPVPQVSFPAILSVNTVATSEVIASTITIPS